MKRSSSIVAALCLGWTVDLRAARPDPCSLHVGNAQATCIASCVLSVSATFSSLTHTFRLAHARDYRRYRQRSLTEMGEILFFRIFFSFSFFFFSTVERACETLNQGILSLLNDIVLFAISWNGERSEDCCFIAIKIHILNFEQNLTYFQVLKYS